MGTLTFTESTVSLINNSRRRRTKGHSGPKGPIDPPVVSERIHNGSERGEEGERVRARRRAGGTATNKFKAGRQPRVRHLLRVILLLREIIYLKDCNFSLVSNKLLLNLMGFFVYINTGKLLFGKSNSYMN